MLAQSHSSLGTASYVPAPPGLEPKISEGINPAFPVWEGSRGRAQIISLAARGTIYGS